MKHILICGFKGDNNTAKLILDKIQSNNKLYLENDFKKSVKQLLEVINDYNFIIMLGQKPVIKSIYIERVGRQNDELLTTTYNIDDLYNYFDNIGYKVVLSNNAGNYLCNNIYYHCLKYIVDNKKKIQSVFLHVPTISNIFDIDMFAEQLTEYINNLI